MEEDSDISETISELSKEWPIPSLKNKPPIPSPKNKPRKRKDSRHLGEHQCLSLGAIRVSSSNLRIRQEVRQSQSVGHYGSATKSPSTERNIFNGFSNFITKPFNFMRKNSKPEHAVPHNSLQSLHHSTVSKDDVLDSSVGEQSVNKQAVDGLRQQQASLMPREYTIHQSVSNAGSCESSVDRSSAFCPNNLAMRMERIIQEPLLRPLPSGSSVDQDDYDNRTSLDYQQLSASKNRSSDNNSRQFPLSDPPTVYVPCHKDTTALLSSYNSIHNSSENVSLRQGLSVDMLFCPVCFDTAMFAVEFNCSHVFCGQCFVRCLAYHANWLSPVPCPYCRQEVHTITPRFTEEESKDGPDKQVLLYEIDGYNRKFGPCCSGVRQCLAALPRLLWRLAVRFNLGEVVFHMLMARLVISTVLELYDMRNDILESSVDLVTESLVRNLPGTSV